MSFWYTNCKPVGILSVILLTYPSIPPSLYTLNVYLTKSPCFTATGVLSNVYVAVVALPSASFDVSIFGSCLTVFVLTPSFDVISLINFLKAKSNSLSIVAVVDISIGFSVGLTSTIGCSVLVVEIHNVFSHTPAPLP